jgi:hypothetical protein
MAERHFFSQELGSFLKYGNKDLLVLITADKEFEIKFKNYSCSFK